LLGRIVSFDALHLLGKFVSGLLDLFPLRRRHVAVSCDRGKPFDDIIKFNERIDVDGVGYRFVCVIMVMIVRMVIAVIVRMVVVM